MQVFFAKSLLRMILGDESESVWSDEQVLRAMNTANQRIWRRIVAENPERYATFVPSDDSDYPMTYSANADYKNLQSYFTQVGGTLTYAAPLHVLKLSYSTTSSGLDTPRDIPIVPLSALEDRKATGNTLEYDPEMNYISGRAVYKAAYMPGDTSLLIRPIPTTTLYLRMYCTSAAAADISGTDPTPSRFLLMPAYSGDSAMPGDDQLSGHMHSTSSGLADAVIFDAAYLLSFKDNSMREAFAQERERILATQLNTSSLQEAY